jgi:SAM-dependent methyltransferase
MKPISLDLRLPAISARSELRTAVYCRTWTSRDLKAALIAESVRALDVGAGRHPLQLRSHDQVVTVDFDETSKPNVAVDFTQEWPFPEADFDLIYLSHVVEHLYPADRDRLIRNVYASTRPGGFVLIRVPHRSSIQATGWEHHTMYGMNASMSLCHGYNPLLPMFRSISVGVATSVDFNRLPTARQSWIEGVLNRRFRLTDQFLSKLIGGVEEVQFLLQRLPSEVESRACGVTRRRPRQLVQRTAAGREGRHLSRGGMAGMPSLVLGMITPVEFEARHQPVATA